MSRGEQKTKSLFSGTKVAGNSKAVFSLREGLKGAALQVVITECATSASIFLDECISLTCNSITEVAHGYETGLAGALTVQIGTADTTTDPCISLACDSFTVCPAHDLTSGESGQFTIANGSASTVPAACVSVACDTLTDAAHGLLNGQRIVVTGACTAMTTSPANLLDDCDVAFIVCRTACTYKLSTVACGAAINITVAGTGCHIITPTVLANCGLPTGILVATDFFVINSSPTTFKVATTRANALCGCGVAIDLTAKNGGGLLTFTPNGVIHTALVTGACAAFIIKCSTCLYKIASSKANAEAGTALDISALGGACGRSPASVTFTATAADCTSGTVTVRYSVDDVTYTVDAGAGLLDTPGVILAAGLTVIDNADGLHYNSLEVEVDITNSQWIVNIDAAAKV